MKKYLSIALVIIVVGVITYFVFTPKDTDRGRVCCVPEPVIPGKEVTPLNVTYDVDGEKVTLVNGKITEEILSTPASTITTEMFGEPVYGDVIGGGKDTAASFLIQQGGGTGTFIYVVAAYKIDGKYVGSKAYFLGDRVAPQNIRIVDGDIEVNYATRKDNEPMSAEPRVGVTKYLILREGVLVEK